MSSRFITWSIAFLSLVVATSSAAELKPRIVVLTDIAPPTIEPDDWESTIRLVAHADLFEIEGLVASTGWSNNGGKEHPEIINSVIDAYERDLPNLRRRSNQEQFQADESRQALGYWPSPDYLRTKTVLGSTKLGHRFIGADNNSAGSDLIIAAADEQDDRPVWVLVWGGGNTLAQAVWRVQQERTPEQLREFLHKLRVYTITDQDRPQRPGGYDFSSHFWLRTEFEKDLFFIWDESAWNYQNSAGKSNWEKYATDIQNHGHLGAMYPKYKYGVEGDTPSFLYVWPNGLNVPEQPNFGGWGGYFERGITADGKTTAYRNQRGTTPNPISRTYEARFYPSIYNNFAARMDWAKDGKGNRNPIAAINGDTTLTVLKQTPLAGESVAVDASATQDPDGDKLTYSWWILGEAGTYPEKVSLSGEDTSRATIQIPADSAGKTIHLICEITDDGIPNLTAYRRIIFEPMERR